MARVEKSVFISYRRMNFPWARNVYLYLKDKGYDVFLDYTSIPSGDFEQVIVSNIKARAHFIIILTPTSLDRINQPNDWLRREIETALREKRNIIPLFFDGFNFNAPAVSGKLSGELAALKKYNGFEIPPHLFDEAMEKVCKQFLNRPLEKVLHPVTDEIKVRTKERQNATDEVIAKQQAAIPNLKLGIEKEKVKAGNISSAARVAPQKEVVDVGKILAPKPTTEIEKEPPSALDKDEYPKSSKGIGIWGYISGGVLGYMISLTILITVEKVLGFQSAKNDFSELFQAYPWMENVSAFGLLLFIAAGVGLARLLNDKKFISVIWWVIFLLFVIAALFSSYL